MKFGLIPQCRIFCLEDDALNALDIAEMFGLDRLHAVIDTNYTTMADQLFEIEPIYTTSSLDKMIGSVNMRAGVRTKRKPGHVCRVARGQAFCAVDRGRRIARIDRSFSANADRYVVDLHKK